MQKNIAIFASGSGTNAENIIRYFEGNNTIRVALVLSNNPHSFVLQRAKNLEVPHIVVPKDMLARQDDVLPILQNHHIDFIVLAGFLLRVPSWLVDAYPKRIVNIHPALLPKFGGKGMYGDKVHQAVIEAGEKESGITIHLIDEQYDEGTTVFQAKCCVDPSDTPDSLAQKIHTLEYKHFPHVIEELLTAGRTF